MINFQKLIIEGFCSIQNLELDLNTKGFTIIRGANGTGKTTIFSALTWVLYGKTLKGNSKVTTWDRYKPKKYQGAKVELYFSTQGKTHRIIRCQDYKGDIDGAKGGNRLIYQIDAENIDEVKYKNQIQQLINQTLEMSYNLFINSLMFGQGMTRLIQESNTEQKNLFEEILNLNYLSKAKSIASDKLKDYTKDLENLQSKHNQNQTTLYKLEGNLQLIKDYEKDFESNKEKRLKSIQSQIDLSTKALKELAPIEGTKDIKALKQKQDKVNIKISKLKSQISKAKELMQVPSKDIVSEALKLLKQSKYKEAIEFLEKNQESYQIVEEGNSKLISYNDKAKKCQSEIYKIQSLNSKRESLQSQIDRYTHQLKEERDTKIIDRKVDIQKIKSDIKSIKSEQTGLSQNIDSIKELIGNYTWMCKDPLGNNGIKAFLFESSLDSLNEILASYSSILGFYIKFNINTSGITKNFYTEISLDGIRVSYEELSGGQKQLVNLAMAFAMNTIVTQSKEVNLVFLDEIFESLSADNVEIVVEFIRKIYKDKTLFLITHQESLPIPNSKTLWVRREKGISGYQY